MAVPPDFPCLLPQFCEGTDFVPGVGPIRLPSGSLLPATAIQRLQEPHEKSDDSKAGQVVVFRLVSGLDRLAPRLDGEQ